MRGNVRILSLILRNRDIQLLHLRINQQLHILRQRLLLLLRIDAPLARVLLPELLGLCLVFIEHFLYQVGLTAHINVVLFGGTAGLLFLLLRLRRVVQLLLPLNVIVVDGLFLFILILVVILVVSLILLATVVLLEVVLVVFVFLCGVGLIHQLSLFFESIVIFLLVGI